MQSRSQRIYERLEDHLRSARQSSFEQFDKAILTLSSGGLGLSIAFIGKVSSSHELTFVPVLIGSWILFVGAIVSTLLSFVFSRKAIDRQLYDAEQYYEEGKHEFLNRSNRFAKVTEVCNIASGLCFLAAVVCTVLFASNNIQTTETIAMSNEPKEKLIKGGYTPPKMQVIPDSGLEKGFVVGPMQKIPVTPPSEAPAAPPTPAPVNPAPSADSSAPSTGSKE